MLIILGEYRREQGAFDYIKESDGQLIIAYSDRPRGVIYEYYRVGKIDPILSRGMSLDYLGVRNWALGPGGALNAISELEALGVAILGRDVYQLVGKI